MAKSWGCDGADEEGCGFVELHSEVLEVLQLA